jgi:hypothetical protein
MKKQCTKCKRTLSLRLFYRDEQKPDKLTSWCRDCKRTQHIEYYEKEKESRLKYRKNYYKNNRKEEIKKNKIYRRKILIELFELLENKCNRCGITDKRVLQVDHKDGGGNRHRKVRGAAYTYYQDMINSVKLGKNEYQLLCSNCNIIEGIEKGYKKTIWKDNE